MMVLGNAFKSLNKDLALASLVQMGPERKKNQKGSGLYAYMLINP